MATVVVGSMGEGAMGQDDRAARASEPKRRGGVDGAFGGDGGRMFEDQGGGARVNASEFETRVPDERRIEILTLGRMHPDPRLKQQHRLFQKEHKKTRHA